MTQPFPSAPWLFDKADHELMALVNTFVHARTQGESLPLLHPGLHPHGIIEMATDNALRMARALIVLLDSLEAGGMQDRLLALRRLRDEVLNTAHPPLRNNTARVLIQLMKELVRASADPARQLPLAHEFHRAAQGNPRIVRDLLARYHLLEMPEAWNQHAFDHHVHDANTKGRKNSTHLVMDAWVKGLRFLTVVYYNTVEEEAARELLQAAHIMGITVRIGIEFRATFQGGLIDLLWSPLHCDDPERFLSLLRKPEIAAVLDDYRPVRHWMRAHALALLEAWNTRHAVAFAAQWNMPPQPSLDTAAFLTYVGQRQPSALHLAEYIYKTWLPAIREKLTELTTALQTEKDAQSAAALRYRLENLEELVPDSLREAWLSPEANPELVFPLTPHPDLPQIWQRPPEVLLERLAPLHPCQLVLNLADLAASDVLELLWRGKGRITHLELFNLREWNQGRLQHVEEINLLQRALNEGSTPRLKQVIRQILAKVDPADASYGLFQEIQRNIPTLQEFYALAPLGSRLGTDSTSRSHHTHGMGLVFVETLPPEARAALARAPGQHLTLPVNTKIYSFEHIHEGSLLACSSSASSASSADSAGAGSANSGNAFLCTLLPKLRRIPGFANAGCRRVRGWALEKLTTRVGGRGNLVTLGGVDARGRNNDLETSPRQNNMPSAWNMRYWNTGVINTIKILAGFIPAQLTFWYTANWWVLAIFGPLLWFGITGFRNVVQSVVGGGGFTRSMLLPWKGYISWNRLADSLFYTGISVPLLDVVVRLWLLENLLGWTVQNNALAVYTVIAMVNSIYISGHNLFRGLPREAIIGNLFRSALSIPLSMLLGHGLLQIFTATNLPNPQALMQNCAAIVSKCSSDMVAAVIEGFADRNAYLRRRLWDYEGKLAQVYKNFSKQELLFPRRELDIMLQNPAEYWQKLCKKDVNTAESAVLHMLDMMYFWYYQPRARQAFWRKVRESATEERAVLLAMLNLLELEAEVCDVVLHDLLGKNFGRALAFYLQNHEAYVRDVRSGAAQALP